MTTKVYLTPEEEKEIQGKWTPANWLKDMYVKLAAEQHKIPAEQVTWEMRKQMRLLCLAGVYGFGARPV
jgi:hypothetical protein